MDEMCKSVLYRMFILLISTSIFFSFALPTIRNSAVSRFTEEKKNKEKGAPKQYQKRVWQDESVSWNTSRSDNLIALLALPALPCSSFIWAADTRFCNLRLSRLIFVRLQQQVSPPSSFKPDPTQENSESKKKGKKTGKRHKDRKIGRK